MSTPTEGKRDVQQIETATRTFLYAHNLAAEQGLRESAGPLYEQFGAQTRQLQAAALDTEVSICRDAQTVHGLAWLMKYAEPYRSLPTLAVKLSEMAQIRLSQRRA